MSDPEQARNQITAMSVDEVTPVHDFETLLPAEEEESADAGLPEEALTQQGEYGFEANKRLVVDQDDSLSAQSGHYLGREQRKKLDQDIEALYQRVPAALNDNAHDAMFALESLRQAQNIVIDDMRQYEEALFLVAQVKEMLVEKHNRRRWSYSWGIVVFGYGLAWLLALIAGFFVDVASWGLGNSGGWYAALAGGIGGTTVILHDISWQVSVKQSFTRLTIMKYLVQPVMGLGLGAVMFLIIGAGSLLTGLTDLESVGNIMVDGPGLTTVQILLGFVAGYGQQFLYALLDTIIQRLSPRFGAVEALEEMPEPKATETLETAQDALS